MHALSTSEDPNAASPAIRQTPRRFCHRRRATALVLEEYEHAVARGAKIYGEVCGYGSTCDAYHMTSPAPDAAGGARAMIQAMEEAGYSESDRVYVNAHGHRHADE